MKNIQISVKFSRVNVRAFETLLYGKKRKRFAEISIIIYNGGQVRN